MVMKGNAWDWYQRNIEDQVYSDSPTTWKAFRQTVLDEFLTPVEQQNRALWFDRLRQTFGTIVAEHAKEFIKLAKYAPYIVPIEAARVDRFKAGLILALYKTLVVTKFSSLTKLIDRAK